MSVNAVAMFYGKLASDMMLAKEFAHASSVFAIEFAAERGYLFTEYDLQMAGVTMQGHAKRLGDDVKQMLELQQKVGLAVKGVGSITGQVVGHAASQSTDKSTAVFNALNEVLRHMSNFQVDQVHGRLGEVLGTRGGAKKGGKGKG
ncbi:MAG: hypothetical protein ABJB74_17880 [Gemmatimonas sp.]